MSSFDDDVCCRALAWRRSKKSDNAFAALAEIRDRLPPGTHDVEQPIAHGPARAVIRLGRAKRGGKAVTIVDKLALPPGDLTTWCRELKQALGCGGSVEHGTISCCRAICGRDCPGRC